MTHVRAHRWADAMQGRVDDRERATMERHAETCARCAKARDRVDTALRGTGTFAAIRRDSAPELGWDSIRARVHWDVSSARRTRPKLPRPRPRWLVPASFGFAAIAAAAAVAGAVWTHGFGALGGDGSDASSVAVAPVAAPAAKPASLVGVVSRFAGEVMIDGIRRPDTFDHEIGAGALLATGDGRLDVQFGDASALSLAPHSRLELRRFDAQGIELVVDGTVDVEVAPRASGQRFVVIAGDETIEVRGTQFRVDRDATGTHVACRHGLVAVRDARGEVAVGAAKRVDVPAGHAAIDSRVVTMSADELARLAQATPVTTPGVHAGSASTSADDSRARAAATVELSLEVGAIGARVPVRVDGVELGDAPMRVRVTPGRHLVEASPTARDGAARFQRVGWVTVEADKPATVRVEVASEVTGSAGRITERRHQLDAGIDHARLATCVRPLVKDGITGLAVQIEIGVDAAGAINFLNLADPGDLDAATATCVHDVLADVKFPAGAAATWHERVGL